MLKKLKEDNLGHVANGAVCVNIELIWLQEKTETKFIKEFAKTYAHELLHILLAGAIGEEIAEIEEEEIIRAMLGEEWDREIEAMYAEKAVLA